MRLAVFVDGENIAADHASAIWEIARGLASPILARVYGDVSKLTRWQDEANFNLIHSGAGKNATDLLLCVDVMDHVLTSGCDTLLVASSDRDFSHLALRLREKGLHVVGVGEAKTSPKFRAACSVFHVLEHKAAAKPSPVASPVKPKECPPALALVPPVAVSSSSVNSAISRIDEKIRAEIACASQNGAGLDLQKLSIAMHQKHQFLISSTGEKTWRQYLGNRPSLYALDPKGPNAKVRFLAKAFKEKGAIAG